MILTDFGPVTAYRMHAPRWATAPTSGAGAAIHGGRANRPGIAALYLSPDSDSAIREYHRHATQESRVVALRHIAG